MATGGRPQLEDIYALGVEPREIKDPGNAGAIDVQQSGYVLLVSAGAETRTLARPQFVGQVIDLICKTDGGDNVVTVTGTINATGNNTITFNDVGDHVRMVGSMGAAGVLQWRVIVNDGASLSSV